MKRWIDTMKECLRKRGLDVSQARRMAGFVRGNEWGTFRGIKLRP